MEWTAELRQVARLARTALNAAMEKIGSPPQRAPTPRPAREVEAPPKLPVAKHVVPLGKISRIDEFGSNPGRLRMLLYCPPRAPCPNGPLVVLLHGCGQEAVAFASDTGWIALSRRFGFPLVLTEQRRANNAGACFNWFRQQAVERGEGEAASVREMVAFASREFRSDPRRIFVVGLSAGGAMAAALLAAYPDVFAAGAIFAGLPVGCAFNETEAFLRMSHAGPVQPDQVWGACVLAAAPPGYARPWPRVSIWRGEADRVVDPMNGELLARQWTNVHGLDWDSGTEISPRSGVTRGAWGNAGWPAVELWTLAKLGHAVPIHDVGHASQWVMQARFSALHQTARFFGLR